MPKPAALSDLNATPEGYFSMERDEMMAFVPQTARRVLEVGCGSGVFGANLKRRFGAEVWGIERDPDSCAEAEKRLDCVLPGDASKILRLVPDGYFDCIVFNDVLEHLVDPYSLLLETKSKLAPNGVVVCSIPNVRYYRVLIGLLVRKDWQYEEKGILDQTHLRFFTERSIRGTFGQLGYEIVDLRGINPTNKRRVHWVRRLSLGWFSDIAYLQFGCCVRPRS